MKKFLPLLILFWGLQLKALPQSSFYLPSGVVLVGAAPAGSCTSGTPGELVVSSGAFYTCQAGTWGQVGSGGSGVSSITWSLPGFMSASPNPISSAGTQTFSFTSQVANQFLASPDGVSGVPVFRSIVAGDIPVLNQNTTGSSGSVSNSLTLNNAGTGAASGSTYNGSSAITLSYNTLGASPTASPSFTGSVTLPITGLTQCLHVNTSGVISGTGVDCGSGGGGGVTTFSAGNLSPLFTSSVATPTTTPALTFTLSNAAQNSVFAGPSVGGAGAPSFQTAPTFSAANLTSFPTFNQSTTGNAATVTTAASVANSSYSILAAPSTSGSQSPATVAGFTINPSTGATAIPGPVSLAGSTHGITIPAGTAVSGVLGSVIYASDATSGFAEVNENNTGLSRVCTAANGLCSGTGGTAGGALAGTYPNPTLANATSCTNQVVTAISQTTAAGTCSSVANAMLVNTATTVNGQTCTLGSTCTVPLTNGTNTQTASYTLVSSDSGKLVIMNCASACTLTMFGSPTSTYFGAILSIGANVPTISLNTKNYNGSASVPVINNFRPLYFWSDGTNYFGDAPLLAGTNVTFTPASNSLTIAASATASTAFSALSGSTNTTAAMVVGTGASLATSGTGTIAATSLTSTPTYSCEVTWSGTGTSNALQATDDNIAKSSCFNKTGKTWTITGVYCMTDVASNTTSINPTFGASGSGTSILTGALTCGSSFAWSATGTLSGTPTIVDGNSISPVMGGTLTGTSVHMLVTYTRAL